METLNTYTFHVEEYITKKLEILFIKRKFNCESKHNAQVIYNKKINYLNKRLDKINDDP